MLYCAPCASISLVGQCFKSLTSAFCFGYSTLGERHTSHHPYSRLLFTLSDLLQATALSSSWMPVTRLPHEELAAAISTPQHTNRSSSSSSSSSTEYYA